MDSKMEQMGQTNKYMVLLYIMVDPQWDIVWLLTMLLDRLKDLQHLRVHPTKMLKTKLQFSWDPITVLQINIQH
jgi:hypothetical protein